MRPKKTIAFFLFWFLLVLGFLLLKSPVIDAPRTAEAAKTLGAFIQGTPLNPRERPHDTLFETLAPEACGIDMVQPLDITHPMKRLYDSGFAAGAVALGDIDADGRLDVFFSSGPRQNRLYRQLASDDGIRFENISEKAGIGGGDKWAGGAVMADIDGDGDLDIYVCYYDSPNQLFVNEGAGRFSEQAQKHGLAIRDASLFPAFADYDNDGDLDCYLLTHRYYRAGGLPEESPFVRGANGVELLPGLERFYRITKSEGGSGQISIYGRPDYLLRNDDGVFRDVSADSGITGDGFGLSATWCDFNRDGHIDIYVANDGREPDRLYANLGDGNFRDVSAFTLPQTTWFSMGSDVGDLNNDGQFDLFAVDMSSTTHYKQKTTMGAMNSESIALVAGPPPQLMRNGLLINSGAGRFREAAYMTGLASSDWSWAPKISDFDGDGWLDIFITNGVARNFTDSDLAIPVGDRKGAAYWDHFENSAPRPEQNLARRNLGDLAFDNVSAKWGLDHTGMTYAAATGDLDNDGDLDLVCINLDEPVSVYLNRQTEGHSALIRLKGAKKNSFGIGAMVALESDSGWQIRQLNPMTGFLSGNDPRIHFGLGADSAIKRLVIQWPGGAVQQFVNLPVDHLLTIDEGATDPSIDEQALDPPFGTPMAPVFQAATYLEAFSHRENEYDDYQRQPLLPKRLSRFGPGIAVGDINGDGRDDFYLGGAAGQTGSVLLHRGNHFQAQTVAAFAQAKASEDMGALFFDADGDDDLDLYVVSGGYEFEENSSELQDRLYLNDAGRFAAAPAGILPEQRVSGSCVVACDFDRDGDLDLFVGGRLTPGGYPQAPESQLLRNDGGRFVDVADELAPGLRTAGMVSAALWSDVDNDAWLDLIIAPEWGPVSLFRNESGKLVPISTGIESLSGWWNGITGRDIDGDGDIDYVATNYGINSKYHASSEHPATLHFGHFDDSGSKRLIEGEHEGDTLYPIRGKSCSSQAMPHLGTLFPKYHQFALASLPEIYSDDRLDRSECFTAATLSSTVFLNDGTGQFTARPLPRIAQVAPSFGVSFTEINGDGHPDLCLAQNFSHMQPETGPMTGGLSQALLGNGDGSFRALPPAQSGIVIPGDARSLVTCSINRDHLPDMVVGINDGHPIVLQHRGASTHTHIQVRLVGQSGNRDAIGARVTLHSDTGLSQTAEIYAGDGYLSQSSTTLSFGLPEKSQVRKVIVRWPDGETKSYQRESQDSLILLRDSR